MAHKRRFAEEIENFAPKICKDFRGKGVGERMVRETSCEDREMASKGLIYNGWQYNFGFEEGGRCGGLVVLVTAPEGFPTERMPTFGRIKELLDLSKKETLREYNLDRKKVDRIKRYYQVGSQIDGENVDNINCSVGSSVRVFFPLKSEKITDRDEFFMASVSRLRPLLSFGYKYS